MMKKAFLYSILSLMLIGCAVEPLSHVSAIKDKNYLLGLYPADITDTNGEDQAYELLVCPIRPAYDAETVKSDCRQALVTQSNRPVVFTTVYPEISDKLGNKEFHAMLVPPIVVTPIVAKILKARNLKIPDLSASELKALMQRSNRIVAGVGALSITTLALLYLFEAHVWGADKRELARLQQDIFAKTDLSQAKHTDRKIKRLLALLAGNLDLRVSREAKLLLSNPKAKVSESKANP